MHISVVDVKPIADQNEGFEQRSLLWFVKMAGIHSKEFIKPLELHNQH